MTKIAHNREDKLVAEINDLKRQVAELKRALAKANERAWGNEEAARDLWEIEAQERGRQGIYG